MNQPEIEAIVESLTDAQKSVLEHVVDRSSTHSGRGGNSVQTMRALERKGLVKKGKEHTWETDWHFTEVGAAVGKYMHQQRLDEDCRKKSTRALKDRLDSLVKPSAMHCASIAKELEIRGWQRTSDGWTRVHTPDWTVVEGIAGIYSYHVRDASQSNANTLPAACDARVMSTGIPLSTWGLRNHIPSRWCSICAARAELTKS